MNTVIRNWIEEVLHKTNSRTLIWRSINPTTYVWEVTSPKFGRIILQRIERIENIYRPQPSGPPRQSPVKKTNYILQVFDNPQGQNPVLNISGFEDADANSMLDTLFTTVNNIEMEENLKFLRSILPS